MEEEKRRIDQKRKKIMEEMKGEERRSMEEMKGEERRSMEKIKKKYETKIRDMEDILK